MGHDHEIGMNILKRSISDDPIRWVFEREMFGIKLGLNNMKRLARQLGDPQLSYPVVHVAGSNGKGSSCSFLSNILTAAGYKVGFYSSPHLIRLGERFRIDMEEASPRKTRAMAAHVKRASDELTRKSAKKNPFNPTFFEITTAMAIDYFRRENVDIALLETGMGGRLDATNICSPTATAITSLSIEHTQWLGDTLGKIAREKAGILKQGVPLITGRLPDIGASVVKRRAEKLNVTRKALGEDFGWVRDSDAWTYVQGDDLRIDALAPGLVGDHQLDNASLAVSLALELRHKGFDIPDDAIRKGLSATRWIARLEPFGDGPKWLLDGAHNPEAVASLANYLKHNISDRPIYAVTGMMSDKDIDGVLEPMFGLIDFWIATRVRYERALPHERLAQFLKEHGQKVRRRKICSAALRLARDLVPDDGLVVVFGSLYIAGEARPWLVRHHRH